jgi:hypothetical protein
MLDTVVGGLVIRLLFVRGGDGDGGRGDGTVGGRDLLGRRVGIAVRVEPARRRVWGEAQQFIPRRVTFRV